MQPQFTCCVELPFKGFTLIELLVVLLLFSLLAGLAIPRLTTMYESTQAAYERDEVLARLGELGYLAFQHRRDFSLMIYPPDEQEESDEIPLELPEGWQVRAEAPILFFANGACKGGLVYLSHDGQTFEVELEAPFCKPRRVNL
ncbi:MAG TPA: prepilin-type N-terminal cleavage/methylation domain-containing protein [Thiotrichaceae bacterium]|nr:prepilin-type N-terminal cleavage/methylation domain-containing protein [Thiotrichaceae bacterium]